MVEKFSSLISFSLDPLADMRLLGLYSKIFLLLEENEENQWHSHLRTFWSFAENAVF